VHYDRSVAVARKSIAAQCSAPNRLGSTVKLHLGCGKRFIPGYIHIDAIDYPHVDHVAAIDDLGFLPDDSCEVIYNCHVLEHFKRRDVGRVLKEWHRVLRPGGVLRTSVPDFTALCAVYAKYEDIDRVIGPLFGGQNYLYNIHYNVFDFRSLCRDLTAAGFDDITRYDWRHTEHADVDDYAQAYVPHMDKDCGIQISLNVEAVKAPS
jgi:SAM-dependent methyltransferase